MKRKLARTVEDLENINKLADDYRKAKLAKNIIGLKNEIDS